MKRYSYGMTPPAVIRDALQAMKPREPGAAPVYSMELVGQDAEVVQNVVNKGIDSHLEACFIPDRGDVFEWVSGTKNRAAHLRCLVSVDSMLVLLRRLAEFNSPDCEADEDTAMSLRSGILDTLEIEEV